MWFYYIVVSTEWPTIFNIKLSKTLEQWAHLLSHDQYVIVGLTKRVDHEQRFRGQQPQIPRPGILFRSLGEMKPIGGTIWASIGSNQDDHKSNKKPSKNNQKTHHKTHTSGGQWRGSEENTTAFQAKKWSDIFLEATHDIPFRPKASAFLVWRSVVIRGDGLIPNTAPSSFERNPAVARVHRSPAIPSWTY